MKRTKKVSAIIMSIVLLLSTVSMFSTAYACDGCGDDEYHQNGMWRYILENDEAIIVSLDSSEELYDTVTVPETLDGYPVTGISWISYEDYDFDDLFSNEIDLHIPASIIKLADPDWCEFGCGIKSITVDEANPAFSSENGVLFNKDKTELIRYPQSKTGTTYNIPNSVKVISEGAFYSCYDLENVTIPDGITAIKSAAFGWCQNLKNITLPNSLTTIGDYAFEGCDLTSIRIPGGVTSIGTDAFDCCDGFKTITVDENNQYYSADEYNVLFSKDKATLIKAFDNTLTEYTIPDSVTTIEPRAFSDFYELSDITLPDSLKHIGRAAFFSCEKLTYINLPEGIETIAPYAFAWSGIETLYIPASIKQIDCFAAQYSDIKCIYFGGSSTQWNAALTEMCPEDYWYDGDYTLTQVDIRYNYVLETDSGSCGENATWFFNGINTLTISGSGAMASYPQGENTPWNDIADKITRLEIKEGITKIDGFYKLGNIETVILPESLEYFESCVFCWNYDDVIEIIYKGMPEQWENIEFGSSHESDGCFCYDTDGVIYIDNEDFVIDSISLSAATTTVKYGETISVVADVPTSDNGWNYFLPVGTHLSWYGENDGYFNGYTYDGEEYHFYMTSENDGTTTVTVCLENEDGWTVYNEDGDPVEASITLTSKVGVIELISYFFRELFNILFGWLMF